MQWRSPKVAGKGAGAVAKMTDNIWETFPISGQVLQFEATLLIWDNFLSSKTILQNYNGPNRYMMHL